MPITLSRKAFLCFLLIFGSLLLVPQKNLAQNVECSCYSQLSFLAERAKKAPAFKVQLRKNKRKTQDQVSRLLEQSEYITTKYDCFVLLNQFILTLNDNHAKVLGASNPFESDIQNDSVALLKLKKNPAFTTTKKLKFNLDSLEKVLRRKPLKAIEGIYHRPPYATIGVFKSKKSNHHLAVILSTVLPLWERGEILYTFIPFGNDYYKMIGGSLSTKRLIALNERFSTNKQNAYLLSAEFQKDTTKSNYSISPYPNQKFLREELGPDLSYIKVGSFNSFYPTLSEAEDFYASLENTLKKKHLILDLRDNSGGGDRNSDILFNILQAYAKTGQIHVIINHRSASNAEQFAHRIREQAKARLYGDRSNGTLAYEIKKGAFSISANQQNCENFVAILPSKKHKEYLPFESQGISPDFYLQYEMPWIGQILSLIK